MTFRTLFDLPVDAARKAQEIIDHAAGAWAGTPLALPLRTAEVMLRPGLMVGDTIADTADKMMHGVHPSREFDGMAVDDRRFCDDMFRSRDGWQTFAGPDSVSRIKRRGRKIFCETKIVFGAGDAQATDGRSTLQRGYDTVRGPWNGYKGTYEPISAPQSGPDRGKIEYYLYPTGKLPVVGGLQVHETMLEGLRHADGGLRVPIVLEGGAEGLAYIDLHPLPNGAVEMHARFAGVQPGQMGEIFGAEGFGKNHLLGESGQAKDIPLLGFVMKDDGGLVGVLKEAGFRLLPPQSADALRGGCSGKAHHVLGSNRRPRA